MSVRSAASSCGITWGSLPKTSAAFVVGRVDGVRAGRYACFDRLLIDVSGRAPGSDGQQGATGILSMPSVAGFETFRQVTWAGSFEGSTTVALGVRARLPHRVLTIHDAATNRSRVVVDVAHSW